MAYVAPTPGTNEGRVTFALCSVTTRHWLHNWPLFLWKNVSMCEGRGEFAFFSCCGNPKVIKAGDHRKSKHPCNIIHFHFKTYKPQAPPNPAKSWTFRSWGRGQHTNAAGSSTRLRRTIIGPKARTKKSYANHHVLHNVKQLTWKENVVHIKKPCAYTPPFTPMLPGDSSYQLVHTQASLQADLMELQSEKQNTPPQKDNCSFSGL